MITGFFHGVTVSSGEKEEMSSLNSSDSSSSSNKSQLTKIEETVPLMISQAPPKNYGSLYMYYHLMKNSSNAAAKVWGKKLGHRGCHFFFGTNNSAFVRLYFTEKPEV